MDETVVGAMSIMKTPFSPEELILLFGGRRGTQEGKKQRVEERRKTGAVWTVRGDTLDSS